MVFCVLAFVTVASSHSFKCRMLQDAAGVFLFFVFVAMKDVCSWLIWSPVETK